MKYLRGVLLYLICISNNISVVPMVLLIHVLWGSNLRLEGMSVCTDLREDSWPVRTWYSGWGGTTFGHAIMYGPNPGEDTKTHEHAHVEQCEASMIKSLILGLIVLLVTGKLWLSYTIWSTGYLLMLVGGWLAAGIRGENMYSGSVHEEHANAIEGLHEKQIR